MAYWAQDIVGLAIGSLIAPVLAYLPGLGLAMLLGRFGLDTDSGWRRLGWAMLLALGPLPVLDVLAIRLAGMPGMLALNLALALPALPLLRRPAAWPAPGWLFALLGWWLVCAWSYADIDWHGRLYQSLIAVDMVKHAAVVEQIARQGIPFSDPFFARPEIAGYYHYFYVWPAAVRWISAGTVSATMAFGATAFWTGLALPALLWRIAREAGLIRPGRGRRMLVLAVLFCFVAGADLLYMALRYAVIGRVEPQLDSWNEEIRFIATSVLWVPHHIVALVAGWTGMLLAVRAGEGGTPRRVLPAVAGAAFATMFGASIWIALALAPLLAGWTLVRLMRRDPTLLVAGIVAILLSVPQMLDLLHGRAPGPMPIAVYIRPFTLFFTGDTLLGQFWCLLLLPLNYALEFGLFAYGAVLYWRGANRRGGQPNPVRALLLWSAILSLMIGSVLRSTIINNDFGWRAVLFAEVAAILWTMSLAQSLRGWHMPRPALILLLLGLAGTAWDLAGLRFIRPPLLPVRQLELNSDPVLDYQMRAAYGWADRALPDGATLQHGPVLHLRGVDFGLYGRHWPAVADAQATLFGASKQAVERRLALIGPVFDRPMPVAEIARRAREARVGYFLFTARDRAWRRAGGPPAALPCLYRASHLCIAAAPREPGA